MIGRAGPFTDSGNVNLLRRQPGVSFAFAPAIEYKFSGNVGVIAGVHVIPGNRLHHAQHDASRCAEHGVLTSAKKQRRKPKSKKET